METLTHSRSRNEYPLKTHTPITQPTQNDRDFSLQTSINLLNYKALTLYEIDLAPRKKDPKLSEARYTAWKWRSSYHHHPICPTIYIIPYKHTVMEIRTRGKQIVKINKGYIRLRVGLKFPPEFNDFKENYLTLIIRSNNELSANHHFVVLTQII